MLFWIGILFAGFSTWFAIKIGFYETIVLFFNILISIYVSTFLTPVFLKYFSSVNDTLFFKTFSLVILAVGTFFILYWIAYIFITGEFKITFPKIFENIFSGFIGFLLGFLVYSFITVVITITPFSNNRVISQMGFNREYQQTNIAYICWWCDLVNYVVASSEEKIESEQIIEELFKNNEPEELIIDQKDNKNIINEESDNPPNTNSDPPE